MLCSRYSTLCTQLQQAPETTEAMDEQEKFMTSIAAELNSLQQRIADSQHTFDALQSSWYITEEEESEVFWGMRRWPNKLAEVGPVTFWYSGMGHKESQSTKRCRRRFLKQGADM